MFLDVWSQYLLSPLGLEGVVLTPREKVKDGGKRTFLTTPGGTATAKRRRELEHLSFRIKDRQGIMNFNPQMCPHLTSMSSTAILSHMAESNQ